MALRSAMTMDLRRSEDEKERASHLHDIGEALAIAQRVQLGQPSPTVTWTCLQTKGARAHDQARVKSELDDWGDEVRRAGTAYRAQTFLRAESARVARCFIAPAAGAPIC